MFIGSIVALITPFRGGVVDETRLGELVQFHVREGTQGIVPCGTTGESATLTDDEKERVIRSVISATAGKVPIIAGAGTNSTAHTIHLMKMAKRAGADAVLLVLPYYNKPTQEGLFAHFTACAQAVDIPIVLYNVPGRTSSTITAQTLHRLLSACPTIVGIKEASGSTDLATEMITGAPERFALLSGDDSMTLPLAAVGGRGIISVVANIVPRDVRRLADACASGRWDEARILHQKLYPLIKACFIETNPIPVKTACELMGLASGELRLPLVPMQPDAKQKLVAAMNAYGCLKQPASAERSLS